MESKETSERHVFALTLLHRGRSAGLESQQPSVDIESRGEISSITIIPNVPPTTTRGAAYEI